ncbi:metallophosphoesterase [Gorillibacterium sp. CAU 1737]|uniref:metallophosphoesterase family protein n=1 Tax=Gorillibacterium sp. CAU 1737 TaxID=3140362 RepID=UPI00326019D4
MENTSMMMADAFAFTALRPWFGRLPEEMSGDYSFVIMGDRTGGAVSGVFERGLEAAKKLNPAFILTIGDLVEGYWTDEGEAHEEWERVDAYLSGVGIPLFQTVGNHDYGTETMRKVWRERKGADYYAFRYGKTLFLVANTEAESEPDAEELASGQRVNRCLLANPQLSYEEAYKAAIREEYDPHYTEDALINPHIGEEQLAFFADVVEKHADVEWTFLLLHQPAWKKSNPAFERLEQLLAGRRYTVVSGHIHHLEVTEKSGSQYIQMGKTGGLSSFKGKGDIHHLLNVTMRGGVPEMEVILLEGEGGTDSLSHYVKAVLKG